MQSSQGRLKQPAPARARPSSRRTGLWLRSPRSRICRRRAWRADHSVFKQRLSRPGCWIDTGWRDNRTGAALALDPLLLAVHGGFDAARGARIFPRHLAQRRTGRFLFLQSRQRLSEPQQRVGRLGRLVELGGDREEGFRGVAILLALEKALAEPVLRIRDQGIARMLLREVAHGLFGQRIVLALHVADAEIELV